MTGEGQRGSHPFHTELLKISSKNSVQQRELSEDKRHTGVPLRLDLRSSGSPRVLTTTPWNQLPRGPCVFCRGCGHAEEGLRAKWVLLLKTQKPEVTMETKSGFLAEDGFDPSTSGSGSSTPLLCGAPPSWL